jgi:soluble lytic murein transglycosylase-like protein
VNKPQRGHSTTSSIIIALALFVLILARFTINFQPIIFGLNKELKSSPPETIKAAAIGHKVKDPLIEPILPDEGGIYKATLDEAAELIDELAQKIKEIDELIQYWQTGINDLENQIIQEAQKKKIISYTQAVINKRVELKLRTIQRRRRYIRKLENASIWIKSGSEKLLYLKRKTQFDLQLVDSASGKNFGQHMNDLSAAIQKYRPTAENLSIKLQDANILPLETIWSRLVNPEEKTVQTSFRTAGRENLKSIGQGELNYAELSTFNKKISIRLPRYSQFIKNAAKKHGFDWHLIVAQIYQESHLDPMAKSSAGARGIMQILPRTARSLGVKDIYNAVENINAGVQHLKALYDHYEGIAGIDRMIIALAAYNAGRGHVEDARRLAIKKDLNPDSWESLTKTLPLLRYRKYYEKSKHGYCRGTEPVKYTKRIMIYYNILKQQDTEYKATQAKLEKYGDGVAFVRN